MGWWTNVWTQRVQDWTYAPLGADQVPDQLEHKLIEPGQAYLSIVLRSMRVVNVRKGLKRFYGTVHSYISVPHLSEGAAQFHFLTTPSDLQNIDAAHIDRVILLSQRLLGPIPYRGGDVEIELGLFSVKSTDLTRPFLTVLAGMASAASVSFAPVALPFVQPLLQGVRLLFDTQGDAVLEVGLKGTFDKPETGYFLVMRETKDKVKTANLKVQKDYRLVDKLGQPLPPCPYMIICIEASPNRPDWFRIPELNNANNNLQKEIRTGTLQTVQEAWAVFKTTTLTCPDLLDSDAKNLVERVRTTTEEVVGTKLTAKTPTEEIVNIPDLNQYDLYGPPEPPPTRFHFLS